MGGRGGLTMAHLVNSPAPAFIGAVVAVSSIMGRASLPSLTERE